jgi:peptide/nickel transport system substrate-binding protein
MKSRLSCVVVSVLTMTLLGCGRKQEAGEGSGHESSVIVAVEGDIDTFNPLFAEDVTAGEINDLLFPSLVGSDFDSRTGALRYTPLLARSWEFRNGGRDLLFHLLPDARWADSTPVTAHDVRFSYQLYGDPDVASVRQAAVENLRLTDGKPDIGRAVEVVDDTTVIFHFAAAYPGRLFDAGLPILPMHLLSGIPHKELRTHSFGRVPVGSGPFALERWTPLQQTVLRSNAVSTIPFPARLGRLIFRVIPDYRTRVAQLESGEVDCVAGLRPEDALRLAANPALQVTSIAGRDYDFLGWNNIDPERFASSGGRTIVSHRLFGSARTRTALTMAIDRRELVAAYLAGHGSVAIGGISPLFRWAYNDTIVPIPFDPEGARTLLAADGWKDADGDGVLERQGTRFSFTLKFPSGNQLRNSVATAVQRQLARVGVEMKVEQVERGTFWEDVTARKYDAWLAGFSVPLQMQLDDLWGSDLAKYPFNLTGFRNGRVDRILAQARDLPAETDGAALWKEFQVILHREQPCTFLYWINNTVAVNKRVGGTRIGVLGLTHRAWEWTADGTREVIAKNSGS